MRSSRRLDEDHDQSGRADLHRDHFDWTRVAVAEIVSGVSDVVGGALAAIHAPALLVDAVSGVAGGIAGAGARSLMDGSDFGDNLRDALPDVIASTVGNAIARGMTSGRGGSTQGQDSAADNGDHLMEHFQKEYAAGNLSIGQGDLTGGFNGAANLNIRLPKIELDALTRLGSVGGYEASVAAMAAGQWWGDFTSPAGNYVTMDAPLASDNGWVSQGTVNGQATYLRDGGYGDENGETVHFYETTDHPELPSGEVTPLVVTANKRANYDSTSLQLAMQMRESGQSGATLSAASSGWGSSFGLLGAFAGRMDEGYAQISAGRSLLDQRSALNTPWENARLTLGGYGAMAGAYLGTGTTWLMSGALDTLRGASRGQMGAVSLADRQDTDRMMMVGGAALTVLDPLAAGSVVDSVGGINLAARPAGIEFEGTVFRLENPKRVSTTFDVHAGNAAADHRYSGPGLGAVYGGTSPETAFAEVEHYGLTAGRVSASKQVSLGNVLDLTNSDVRNELGVTLEQIAGDSYATTHQLGVFARTNGYDGILAPSARNPGGSNLVIFP